MSEQSTSVTGGGLTALPQEGPEADSQTADIELEIPAIAAGAATVEPTEPITGAGHHDLSHLTPAELAAVIASTEEMNEADEIYAATIAELEDEGSPAEAEVPEAEVPDTEVPAAEVPRAALPEAEAVEAATAATRHVVPHSPAGGGRPGQPGGKPGAPRRASPTPRPAAGHQGGHTAPVVTEPLVETSDPTPWGRVDADGTVYVVTSGGDRVVGSWQAGDPAAGLAHYGRRYDDFITEIALLEKRLTSRSGDAKATRTHAQMLRESIDTLPAVGDLDSAAARLETLIGAAEQAVSHAAQDRANAKAAAVATREALCVEAEALAESNQWKAAGDRLKAILEEWRTIRGIDRKTDDLLWKRFAKARDTFTRRRGSHFAELDKERGAAKDVKEKLIARAEELADSNDFAETATEYRTLMSDWKASGRAPRDVEDALWERFRDAQERFFSRRQKTFADRDAEFEANATVKQGLLAEAEKIDLGRGLDAAKASLRSVQERWEAAGKVPRERIRTLDAGLRAVEDRIKSAEDSMWRKTDPETTARLAQFRSRFEAYQAQADKATAAGDAKRAAAAQAQANQWQEWLRAAENAVD